MLLLCYASPAGGRVDTRVRARPPVDDGVPAVYDAALVGDGEGAQAVQVVPRARVVGLLGQRADSRPDVVRNYGAETRVP